MNECDQQRDLEKGAIFGLSKVYVPFLVNWLNSIPQDVVIWLQNLGMFLCILKKDTNQPGQSCAKFN